MSRILIVDWLGRGGIAHTTGAWASTLAGSHEVTVVTRPGRELNELSETMRVAHAADRRGGRLVAHAALVRAASRLIADWRPELVVVQNFVVAPLERPLAVAAARASAQLVYVIHDHRLHSVSSGTRAGLRSSLRAADEVWAHTDFVGAAVREYAGRPTRVVPLPVPLQLLRTPAVPRRPNESGAWTAVHFGILKRGYKGTDRVLALAEVGVPDWCFRLFGVGAPVAAPGVESTPGFVASDVLTAALGTADAAPLPYRRASQSGAVVLAQALGAVPVASAVGGIPEQIEDGKDGLLLPTTADLSAWREALRQLANDPCATAAMAQAGARRVWEGHRSFEAAVEALAGSHVNG